MLDLIFIHSYIRSHALTNHNIAKGELEVENTPLVGKIEGEKKVYHK